MSTPDPSTPRLADALVVDPAGINTPLGHFGGSERLLVYFMRTFDCPICRAHVRVLRDRHDELRALGARVVVVGPGRPEGAAALAARYPGLPFPVVADTTGDAYRAAHLRKALFGTIQQSGFVLLDAQGEPRLEHAATIPLDALDLGAILAELKTPRPSRQQVA